MIYAGLPLDPDLVLSTNLLVEIQAYGKKDEIQLLMKKLWLKNSFLAYEHDLIKMVRPDKVEINEDPVLKGMCVLYYEGRWLVHAPIHMNDTEWRSFIDRMFGHLTEARFTINCDYLKQVYHTAIDFIRDPVFGLRWEANTLASSPKDRRELEQLTSHLEDIHEKITHISEEMYARVRPRVNHALVKLANGNTVDFNFLNCLSTLAEELRKEIEYEERDIQSGSKKATQKVRQAKNKIDAGSL